MAEKIIDRIGHWDIVQFEYDGAPVEARQNAAAGISIENDADDLTFRWTEKSDDMFGKSERSCCVPKAVLLRVLRGATNEQIELQLAKCVVTLNSQAGLLESLLTPDAPPALRAIVRRMKERAADAERALGDG